MQNLKRNSFQMSFTDMFACVTCPAVIFSNALSGTTKDHNKTVIACAGGAIEIHSEKNLTISKY